VLVNKIAKTALLLFTLNACAASGDRMDWHERDWYSGWVTDATTGKPIEGAAVVGVWQIIRRHHMFIVEGTPDIKIVRLGAALTDKDGRFRLPPLGDYSPPLGWERDDTEFPKLAFFKPGYEPTFRQRFTWEFGDRRDVPAGKAPPRSARDTGWEREIQLYPYLTRPVSEALAIDPIYQGLTDHQKILEPLRGFASFLARNVENSDARNASPLSPLRRKAVQAQWQAITMIDGEIRRYQPKYDWHDTAIREALKQGR
jgi:hypothetical protein